MSEPESDKAAELGKSFRQSRKEMWVMVGAWAFFFAWTLTYCSLNAGKTDLTLGMPRWVLFGIAVPWLVANGFIIWFSMCYMKDTPLEDESSEADSNSGEVNSDR